MANPTILMLVLTTLSLAFSGTAAAWEAKAAAAAGVARTAPRPLARALQEVLDREVGRLRVPGIQASVRVGRFTWSGVSGYKDLKRQAPLDTTDILRIGSVTKTFTAGVVLKLSERYLVTWTSPSHGGSPTCRMRARSPCATC